MRVTLFTTCLVDTLFPAVGKATVSLLGRLGHRVAFPAAQTCCGQMHLNTGAVGAATALARRNVRVLDRADTVVVPSASCAATIVEDYEALAEASGERRFVDGVRDLRSRTFELSQFLTDVLGVEDVGARLPARVTYHPSCHALRKLRIDDGPLRLLRAVEGLEVRELRDADACCGFGGTFAVKNSNVSAAIGLSKIQAVRDSGADVCTALDGSCLMQIQGLLAREHETRVRTMHLAEILARSEGAA